MKKLAISIIAILSAFLVYSQQTTYNGYKITNKIHLEGDEKWDYLYSDDQANRLYVSHGGLVQVVDEVTGKLLGNITGMKGVHGIAIASLLNKGFITSGKDSSVTIFDTRTLQLITRVTMTGKGPDGILFDPFSQKVFVFNGKSHNSTVINPQTNQVIATITLSGKPEASVSDGKGKIYVNFEDKSNIALINPADFTVENEWQLSPGEGPTGLAIDTETHRLFSVCSNKLLVVVNAVTGEVIANLPIGEKTDGTAFDPGLKRIYCSNGDLTMTVVQEGDGDKFVVLENFPTQKGARTITVNKLTHHIYLPSANFELQQSGEKPKIIPGSFVILDIAPLLN